MKLEEKIMLLRKKNGWSQEELAFRLDVSRQAVSKWEMGSSLPDLDNVLKMSELFGCSTDYLLKDDAEPQAAQKTEKEAEPPMPSTPQKPRKTVWKCIEDLFWMLVLCGYLVWSFLSGAWYITWIVFPIAGVVFALLESVLRVYQAAKENKRNEKD
ncbi:MAG: helix-turn-helix transcriptional regulator [Clostridia bacterium]|nr:helix-turn-helix transcriptional regulator [Clostridia bacterium]